MLGEFSSVEICINSSMSPFFEWAQVVAFDGPAKPPVTPDDILDTPSSKLRLDLQPYLSLLELDWRRAC